MNNDSNIRQTAEVIEGIVESVPICQDAVQPAAKEVGKALETVTKAINVALAPISAMVWGYDEIKGFVESRVAEKLKNVPQEQIQTPSPLVAGPLLEALRYAGHEKTLRELYANLLANSIDSETVQNAHPSFIEILKNISPDEAKIMKLYATENMQPLIDIKANIQPTGFRILSRNFSFIGQKANCEHVELTPNYLNNLCRLGLLEIPHDCYIIAKDIYEELESDKQLDEIKQHIEATDGLSIGFNRKEIGLTDLGSQFCLACVIDKSLQAEQKANID